MYDTYTHYYAGRSTSDNHCRTIYVCKVPRRRKLEIRRVQELWRPIARYAYGSWGLRIHLGAYFASTNQGLNRPCCFNHTSFLVTLTSRLPCAPSESRITRRRMEAQPREVAYYATSNVRPVGGRRHRQAFFTALPYSPQKILHSHEPQVVDPHQFLL